MINVNDEISNMLNYDENISTKFIILDDWQIFKFSYEYSAKNELFKFDVARIKGDNAKDSLLNLLVNSKFNKLLQNVLIVDGKNKIEIVDRSLSPNKTYGNKVRVMFKVFQKYQEAMEYINTIIYLKYWNRKGFYQLFYLIKINLFIYIIV